jgi:hypothetical protein
MQPPKRAGAPSGGRGLIRATAALLVLAAAAGAVAPADAAPADRQLVPPAVEGPVEVGVSFHLLELLGIDDEGEAVEFSGILTLTWQDARQAFDPDDEGVREKVYQGDYQFDEIATGWYPQVFLANASEIPETQGLLLRVEPDGTSTLTRTVHAVARSSMVPRRYPFDRQTFELVLQPLGSHDGEVVLLADDGSATADDSRLRIPQWDFASIRAETRAVRAPHATDGKTASAYVVRIGVRRQSFFMTRLVILPLAVIVMLSWSVFWMDRSSLGDRMAVSFVGILTAVAYQTMVSGMTPEFAEVTFMHAFLSFSFLVMCASAVENLLVGSVDARGQMARGDRIDRRSRWLFPLAYLVLIAIAALYCFGPWAPAQG